MHSYLSLSVENTLWKPDGRLVWGHAIRLVDQRERGKREHTITTTHVLLSVLYKEQLYRRELKPDRIVKCAPFSLGSQNRFLGERREGMACFPSPRLQTSDPLQYDEAYQALPLLLLLEVVMLRAGTLPARLTLHKGCPWIINPISSK